MSKITLFENGYLKKEYLNRDYKGLTGFKCFNKLSKKDSVIEAVINNIICERVLCSDMVIYDLEDLEIYEFSPLSIPKGELCWYSHDGKHWYMMRLLEVSDQYGWNYHTEEFSPYGGNNFVYCVPLLIAKNPKEAEKLKDWDK